MKCPRCGKESDEGLVMVEVHRLDGVRLTRPEDIPTMCTECVGEVMMHAWQPRQVSTKQKEGPAKT